MDCDKLYREYFDFLLNDKGIKADVLCHTLLKKWKYEFTVQNKVEADFVNKFFDPVNFFRFITWKSRLDLKEQIEINHKLIGVLKKR